MSAILLGLGAAITYGAADFVGGLVSRRVNALIVVLLSQGIGLVVLLAALPFGGGESAVERGLGWGAAAGVGGGAGVLLLYRGLAVARMSVVAPITAVEAAAVPVVVGLVGGERPGPLPLIGVIVALIAVALISSTADTAAHAAETIAGTTARRSGLPEALGAGACFGLFFILLDRAGSDSGLWPLVGTKMSSITLVALIALVTRPGFRVGPGELRGIGVAGILDMAANLFYLLAVRRGLLSLVAVLTSMYPGSTVLLARMVLRERLSRAQIVGLACAAAGIALIAGG